MIILSLAAISFLFFGVLVNAQFTCSPSQPCEIGCCTKFGSCGLGPDSCGPQNCISNCDRKSECDPGWGARWSAKETCPLNVCCSKFGFCGTTSEFCGNKKVAAPSCSGFSSSKRTIGYYESWAIGRPCDKMYPEGIPTGSYTHLNFAFAFIHPTTFAIAPMSPYDPQLYTRFTSLKNTNPGLQTWISIGGWSMNDADQPTATTFSTLAESASAQSKFFASTLSFLETYGFDGVDLDWEYPVAPERSGKPADYTNFVSFLRNFRNALHSGGHSYGLTITIPSSFWYLQNFDVVAIEKTIDWFNLMSYDLHGTWDSTNKFLGPYIGAHTNLTEIDNALSLLWRNNIKPGNVVLGLGFYGRSFTLADPRCRTPGCKFTSGARAGGCTQSVGTLSFAEIERAVAHGATVIKDTTAAVKMVVYDTDQWVSYDDAETLKMKVEYANAHCLGGIMIWAVSTDDAKGTAANALSLATGRKSISLLATSGPDPLTSCQLGDCGKPCPAGLSPAQRSDGKNGGNAGINTGCRSDSRFYCCPSNDMPTCTWRGTAPFCGGNCNNGEVEVTSSTSGDGMGCWTGHKVLCCTKTGSDSAAGHCDWKGSAPFCSEIFGQAKCPANQQALTNSNFGAGGEMPCGWGSKSLCCDKPPPYTGCAWYYHGGDILGQIPFFCRGTCPAGKALIAIDPTGCILGNGAFCCDNPSRSNDPLVEDFKRRLSTFANDPTCAAFGNAQHSKRDTQEVEVVPTNLSVSQPNDSQRIASLDRAGFTLLLQQLSQIARGGVQTNQRNLMANQFDLMYGDRFGLHVTDVAGYYNDWPNMDQLSLTESLMCMGRTAIRFLSDYHQSRTQLCLNTCVSPGSHDITSPLEPGSTEAVKKSESLVFARNLFDSDMPNETGSTGQPSWGRMMLGIINGRMTLEYEQLIRTGVQVDRATSIVRPGEEILEIVWRLPPGDPTYQDRLPRGSTRPDTYIVFHFHFRHLAFVRGATRIGIHAIVAFHGQLYGPGNRLRRVDGNDNRGRNARAPIMRCNNDPNRDDTFFFYPGRYTDAEAANFDGRSRLIVQFTNHLMRQGLLTVETFTGPNQGQLRPVTPVTECGRQVFDWNGYTRSRQFGRHGAPPPGGAPPSTGDTDDEMDDDGV